MHTIVPLAFAVLLLASCSSSSVGDRKVYSASYVGDRCTMNLDPVVVSLPCTGVVRNVHIGFVAMINPTGLLATREYEAHDIVRRTHVRIMSALVEDIGSGAIDFSKGLPAARSQILDRATRILAESYSKWAYADDYKVDLAITSLFFTEGN